MQLDFDENEAIVWSIESPIAFRKHLDELLAQIGGEEGKFILSQDCGEASIPKNMELILNPFLIDINDKKCLNKLYSELVETAYGEKYYLATQQLLSEISGYFFDMEQEASIALTFEDEIDFLQLMKAVGIKAEDGEKDLLGRLEQYLKVIANLLHKKIIVFVNLTSYLTEQEIGELVLQADYLKIFIVLIESRENRFSFPAKYYIIDKDGCEIF